MVAITALTAYLIIGYVEDFLLNETKRFGPHLATLIGMIIIVVVFIPLFSYLDDLTKKIVSSVGSGSRWAFGRYGFYAFLVLALVVLYALYLRDWFKVSLL